MSHSRCVCSGVKRCEKTHPGRTLALLQCSLEATCLNRLLHVQDTQRSPQDPPTQSVPEIEGQISSAHSTQPGLQGNGSKHEVVRGGNMQQSKEQRVRTTDPRGLIHSSITGNELSSEHDVISHYFHTLIKMCVYLESLLQSLLLLLC